MDWLDSENQASNWHFAKLFSRRYLTDTVTEFVPVLPAGLYALAVIV